MTQYIPTYVAGLLTAFLIAAIMRSAEAAWDWSSETPAAWFQAAGGLCALGATVWFAELSRRSADSANDRAKRLEDLAFEERKRRLLEQREAALACLQAAFGIGNITLEALNRAHTRAKRTSDALASVAFSGLQPLMQTRARAVESLMARETDGVALVALSGLVGALSYLSADDPPATRAELIGEIERANRIVRAATEVIADALAGIVAREGPLPHNS